MDLGAFIFCLSALFYAFSFCTAFDVPNTTDQVTGRPIHGHDSVCVTIPTWKKPGTYGSLIAEDCEESIQALQEVMSPGQFAFRGKFYSQDWDREMDPGGLRLPMYIRAKASEFASPFSRCVGLCNESRCEDSEPQCILSQKEVSRVTC